MATRSLHMVENMLVSGLSGFHDLDAIHTKSCLYALHKHLEDSKEASPVAVEPNKEIKVRNVQVFL